MALAIFVYVILDGYDLGVWYFVTHAGDKRHDRDRMIASIGRFGMLMNLVGIGNWALVNCLSCCP